MAFGIDDVAAVAMSETLEMTFETLKGVSEEVAAQQFGEEAFKEGIHHTGSEISQGDIFVKFSTDPHKAIEAEFAPEKFIGLGIDKVAEYFSSDISSIVEDGANSGIESVEESSEIIQIKTINCGLDGQFHPISGVEFERKVVTTELGEKVEGVFPKFESIFDAQLPENLEYATDSEQFRECNRQLKEKFDSDLKFREQFDERQKENIEDGITPYGFTWHHNEEIGKMQLVDYDSHQKTAHTGGRLIWGGGTDFR